MAKEHAAFRPDIEGLRAVAVALVVLGHARVPGFAGGYVGVDVFFVISGFLITSQQLRAASAPPGSQLLTFYARRARRILPAASLVLAVTVLASYHWLGFVRGQSVAEDGRWTALFGANLHFAAQGNDYLRSYVPPSPLQHYWSLGVEEQFYLVWPLVVIAACWLSPGRGARRTLAVVLPAIIACSLAWSIVQTKADATWAYYSPLTRAWELAAGGCLAVMPGWRKWPALSAGLGWCGICGILASAIFFDSATAFPGFAAALPVAGAALAIGAGTFDNSPRRLLGLRPFQLLGRWSFSLYLWHWPLLTIAAERAGHPLTVTQNLQLVAAAVVLAAATHYLIENPVRFARPLRSRQLPSVAAGAACALAAFAVCQWQIQDHAPPHLPAPLHAGLAQAAPLPATPTSAQAATPDPAEALQALVSAARSIERMPANPQPPLLRARDDFAWLPPFGQGCLIDADVRSSPPCIFGDPEGSLTLVLLGDSHIAMWLGAFNDIGIRNHFRVVLLGKTGCAPLLQEMYHSFGTGSQRIWGLYEECYPWLQDSLQRMAALDAAAVVVSSCSGCDYVVNAKGARLSEQAWTVALEGTLRAIDAAGAKPVVLGDIPRLPGMLDCLALHQREVGACAEPVEAALAQNYNAADGAAANAAGAVYIDPVPWFCSSVCTGVIGDFVPYTNDYHVTATYARSVTPVLEQAILAALHTPAGP